MQKLFLVITALAAMLSGISLIVGLAASNGAPQQAAVSAMAMAFSVIPYVLARTLQLYDLEKKADQRHEELLAKLSALGVAAGGSKDRSLIGNLAGEDLAVARKNWN